MYFIYLYIYISFVRMFIIIKSLTTSSIWCMCVNGGGLTVLFKLKIRLFDKTLFNIKFKHLNYTKY